MTDAALLAAVLADAGVRGPEVKDGRLDVTSCEVDLEGLTSKLGELLTAAGWVTTTDAVARVRQGEAPSLARGARIVSADLHRATDDVTVTIRAIGRRWRVRSFLPVSGDGGVLLTRRFVALDGGTLRYQTAWAPGPDGALAPITTRFVGFSEGGEA